MKKIRLFQLVSVFALALLIGFAYSSNNGSKIEKSDNIETLAMASIQTNLVNADNNFGKCGEGKCGEGKCGDGKTTDTKKSKKKSKKKKDCDTKTDTKTTTTKCGGC